MLRREVGSEDEHPGESGVTALPHKHLWMVEGIFRSMESVLETRPVYHKCDETIREHVFCSLALVLRKELEDRPRRPELQTRMGQHHAGLGPAGRDDANCRWKRLRPTSDPKGTVGKVFQVSGVAMPPEIRPGERQFNPTPSDVTLHLRHLHVPLTG